MSGQVEIVFAVGWESCEEEPQGYDHIKNHIIVFYYIVLGTDRETYACWYFQVQQIGPVVPGIFVYLEGFCAWFEGEGTVFVEGGQQTRAAWSSRQPQHHRVFGFVF